LGSPEPQDALSQGAGLGGQVIPRPELPLSSHFSIKGTVADLFSVLKLLLFWSP
jgi:hypothetical protein